MNEKKYIIEVSHVNKSFKNNKVLKDVTLRCESGRIYGLVGHNGSGKTVLFKTICGFLACDEGTVSVNGKVMGKDKDMLTEAGIIIEDPGSYETGVLTITLNFCTRYEIDQINHICIQC